jgi:hypothetical protein
MARFSLRVQIADKMLISGGGSSGPGRARPMVYALFMILVLLTLGAMWRGHALQLPLFLLTAVTVLLHVVADMTTPLTLSF